MKLNLSRNMEERTFEEGEVLEQYDALIDTKIKMIKDVFPPEEGEEEGEGEGEEGGEEEAGEESTEEAAGEETSESSEKTGEDSEADHEAPAAEERKSEERDNNESDEDGKSGNKASVSGEHEESLQQDKLQPHLNSGSAPGQTDSDSINASDKSAPVEEDRTRRITQGKQNELNTDSRTLETASNDKEARSNRGQIDGSTRDSEFITDDYSEIKKQDDQIVEASKEGKTLKEKSEQDD